MSGNNKYLSTHLNYKCSGCIPISQYAPYFWKSYDPEIKEIRPCSCTHLEPKYIDCQRCNEKLNIYDCLCKSQFDYKIKSKSKTNY